MRLGKLVVINVLVLAVMLIFLEGVSSVLIVVGRLVEDDLPLPSKYADYLSLPMYRDSPEAAEYWNEFRLSGNHQYTDYLGWRRKDYSGKYINIIGGHRLTPTNARQDGPVLAVFGGSAVWGTGVKDSETIPSWIASQVGGKFRVLNFGEAGYGSFQDFLSFYEALQDDQPIRYAVFYDGVNDAHASCVNPGRNRATLNFYPMKEKIEYRKGSDLRVVDLAKFIAGYLRQPRFPMRYRCDDETEASRAALAMVMTWQTITDLADRSGVKAYFFLQPVSYVGNSDVSYLQLDETRRRSFQNFYKHVDIEARRVGIAHYYNLSGLLSDNTGKYYIDFSHVTANANRTIANAIVERMQPW